MTVRFKSINVTRIVLTFVSAATISWGQYFAKPEDVTWKSPLAVFTTDKLKPGTYSNIVNDSLAINGKAIAVTAGDGRDSHILSGGFVPIKTDAKYSVAFCLRMQMKDVSIKEKATVAYAGTENSTGASAFFMPSPLRLEAIHRTKIDDPSTETVIQWYYVDAPNLAAVKDYHDYVLKFEQPVPGFVGFRIYWFGRVFCSAWVDQVKLLEEPLPSEAEQLKEVKFIGNFQINHANPLTFVWTGPYNWVYRIPEVIGGKCDMTSVLETSAELSGMPVFPGTIDSIGKYDVICISSVELGSLSPQKRLLLSEFVKAGGGVVLMGGMLDYGKSQVHKSPLLMDMLPVITKGLWDMRSIKDNGLVAKPLEARLQKLCWSEQPRVYYYHEADVKKDATVWVKGVGKINGKIVDVPLVVTRPYGKGQIVAFLGTGFGMPKNGQVGIWEWKDWGKFVTIMVNAARGKIDDNGTEPPLWSPVVKTVLPPRPAPESGIPAPGVEKPKSSTFEITRVWPSKIRYKPGEWASAWITLVNGTRVPVKGTLTVSVVADIHTKEKLLTKDVDLKAGETTKIPVVWKIGDTEEFGRELVAELTDVNKSVVDTKSETFTIGLNNYRLGQGCFEFPWSWGYTGKDNPTFPLYTPLDRWNEIYHSRAGYSLVHEIVFYWPDDFAQHVPNEEMWFSSQGEWFGSQADVHARVDAAHENGIAAVSYVKNIMGISGLQVKRDGLALLREHPEWCQWTGVGQPKWFFNITRARMTFDERREAFQKGTNEWSGIVINTSELECVNYAAQGYIESAKKYGIDGIRWDDHLTLESVWTGGYNFDGSIMDRGGDFEALSARNNKLIKDMVRAYNPNFLIGYNYAAVYNQRGVRYPEAYEETCKDGQFVMLEWSSWWPASLGTWGRMAEVLSGENHRVQGLGGVPGMCPMVTEKNDVNKISEWESAINYASQGHYYYYRNTDATIRHTRFALRHSGLLYSEKTQFVPNGEKLFSVDASGKCMWKEFVHENQVSADKKKVFISVINMDPAGVIDSLKLPVPVLSIAKVNFTVPQGWKVTQAFVLNPDEPVVNKQTTAIKIVSATGTIPVELKNVACWNMVVFELDRE